MQQFQFHEVSFLSQAQRSAVITRAHQHVGPSGPVLVLRCREVLRLEDAAGTRLRIQRGSVWITQEGDHKDHYLPATGTITLDRTGLALVHALEPAELILSRPVSQISLASKPKLEWRTATSFPARKVWKP